MKIHFRPGRIWIMDMSLDSRSSSLSFLHPRVRDAVDLVLADLQAGRHPFEVFEAFRSPERQRYLYAKGRTTPGPIVTKARPWSSYHQYGLAADFVLKINGSWSWETTGALGAHWDALHEIGRRHGLEPLSWELPHLQLAGLQIGDLRNGRYPRGGDDGWTDNLEAAIVAWRGGERAPPAPGIFGRPPIGPGPDDEDAEEIRDPVTPADAGAAELDRPAVPQSTPEAGMLANQFALIQTYVDKWEGGYVDNPADPGGATNMGITQATLQRWRGRPVSKSEVKALTRAEQRRIMKRLYYDVVRGDQLPAAIAAVTYNAAVLHGTAGAGRLLQRSLNALAIPVEVDGAIGRLTLGAVAQADREALLDTFLQVEEQFLRGLKHFMTFGKGWMSRLEDISTFAHSLLREQPVLAADEADGLSTPGPVDQAIVPKPDGKGVAVKDAVFTPGARDPLTTVNAALGETLGRLLNGRKTAIGILGSVVAPLIERFAAPLGLLTQPNADATAQAIAPVALGALVWGLLGKAEKWTAAGIGATPVKPADPPKR